jgi:NADH dehydrogenase
MITVNAMTSRRIRIVVVGGGAGGLELVKRLGAHLGRQHDIVLVEKNATHIWKPLLHEVAAGSLDANLDETGYREHCYRWHYQYVPGELARLERAQRRIVLAPVPDEDGSPLLAEYAIDYDYLVLAIGSLTNDFGVAGVRRHCLFLDDRTQADRFRTRLLNHCLRVSRLQSADATADAHVQVVIVGGGATGVELAAELYNAASALEHYGLEVFDESRLRVTLVEAGPRILPVLPERGPQACEATLCWRASMDWRAAAVRSWWSVRRCRPRAMNASSRSATAVVARCRRTPARCRRARRPRIRWQRRSSGICSD